MKILIVEDEDINIMILENVLQTGFNCEVLTAHNGKEAIKELQNNQGIQLIISDIMMPEMDGLEFLEELKDSKWKDIPVIMCTALSDLETVRKASRLGCRHYTIKPIDSDQLTSKIKELLDYKTGTVETQKQTGEKLDLNFETSDSAAWEFIDLLKDKLALLEKEISGVPAAGLLDELLQLSKGASNVGADRLTSILEKINHTDTNVSIKEYQALLKELKNIRDMLPYRSSKKVLPSEDLEEFCKYVAEYNPHLVSALEKYVSDHGAKGVMEIKLKDLSLDMIAYEDIWAKNDCLLAAKGQAITKPVIDRLHNFANRVGVLEPFHVLDLTPVR